MSTGAHIVALLASVPSIALIVTLVRRGQLRVKYALLWLPVGAAMIVFAIVPGLLDWFAQAVGVAYPPTILFALAVGLLIFVAVHLSWELSRLDEKVRRLAEYIAIEHAHSDAHPGADHSRPGLAHMPGHSP